MKFWKKGYTYFFVLIVLFISIIVNILFISRALKDEPLNNQADNGNIVYDYNILEKMSGTYKYSEFVPPNINYSYEINIYEEENNYLADLKIDGFQTYHEIKAQVIPCNNGCQLVFRQALNKDLSPYKDGDVLLTLTLSEFGEVQTDWEAISCLEDSIYFYKLYSYKGTWEIEETANDVSDGRFEYADRLFFDENCMTVNSDSPVNIKTEYREVTYPEFFDDNGIPRGTAGTFEMGLRYHGIYSEILLKNESNEILLRVFPVSDTVCILVEPTGTAYRAVRVD